MMEERDKKIILVKIEFNRKLMLKAEMNGEIEKVEKYNRNIQLYETELKEF